jgi:hypothetical protein
LIAVAIVADSSGVVHGAVYTTESNHALAGVLVEEPASGRYTVTDSLGRYALRDLQPGRHSLHFAAIGYEPRSVEVYLGSGADLGLDVDLNARPVILPQVEVRAQPGARATGDDPAKDAFEAGHYQLAPGWQDRTPGVAPDVHRALLGIPGIATRGGDGVSLHVRGGGGQDNLFLLDGLPIYGAAHFGSAAGGVNPEAVARMDAHTGVWSAKYGPALSGVFELETAEDQASATHGAGAVGPAEIRQTVSGPVGRLGGGFLLAARRSFGNLLGGGTVAEQQNGYMDLLATGSGRLAGGRVRGLFYHSGNQLSFPQVPNPLQGQAGGNDQSGGVSLPGPSGIGNNLEWHAHTEGVTWTRDLHPGLRIAVRGWHAANGADVAWATADSGRQLQASRHELAVSGELEWTGAHAATSLGFTASRVRLNSVSSRLVGLSSPAGPALRVADAVLLAGFLERRWHFGDHLSLATGARATADVEGSLTLEPRVIAALQLSEATQFWTGFGETRQAVQSLFNEESILGAALNLDVPSVQGAEARRTARSTQLTAGVRRRFAEGISASVEGYVRRFHNVPIVAAASQGLAAADTMLWGDGTAAGIIGSVDVSRGPFAVDAAFTLARAGRSAGAIQYQPGFLRGRSLAIAAGGGGPPAPPPAAPTTTLGATYQAGAGQAVSVVSPGFEWQAWQPIGGDGDIGGTPTNQPGPVNAFRTPDYARLDLSLRQDWHLGGLGRARGFTTVVALQNLLNRANVVGFVRDTGGLLQPILATRRVLTFELRWGF